jgi:hypothetical protein
MRWLIALCTGRCPHCRSIDFRTVGVRNRMEAAVLWMIRPQRCELCGRHFFLFRWLVVEGTLVSR